MGSRAGVEVPVTVMPSWYNRVYYHCRLGVIYQHMQDLDIQVVAIGLVCYIACGQYAHSVGILKVDYFLSYSRPVKIRLHRFLAHPTDVASVKTDVGY